jgi:hypothetical protein
MRLKMADRNFAQTISFVLQNTMLRKMKKENMTFEYAAERVPHNEMSILCAWVNDKVLNFKEADNIYDLMWEHKTGAIHATGIYFKFLDVDDPRFTTKVRQINCR